MGCWNGTCGISQLHIRAGQRVMVVPLAESFRDSLCYTTPFFTPFPVPFYSEYNDYGAGENSEGIGLDLMLNEVKSRLIEVEQGKNQYHDIPVKAEGFDEELFWNAIHEQRLKVKGHGSKKELEVGFTMIRMDVFDHLAANYEFETYDYDSKKGSTYYHYKLQDILDGVPELVDTVLNKPSKSLAQIKELLAANPDMSEEDRDALFESMDYLRGGAVRAAAAKLRHRPGSAGRYEDKLTNAEGYNRAAAWLEHSDSHMSYGGFGSYALDAYTRPLVEAGNREKLIELLEMHIRLLFIDAFMMHTRKFWSPQAGAGSQSQEADGYRALAAAVVHVLDEERREWDEEEEEDDDEDEETDGDE